MTTDFEVKKAFAEVVDGLEPMPDAVPAVVVRGRRSVRRRRIGSAVGSVATVGALTAGVLTVYPSERSQPPVAGGLTPVITTSATSKATPRQQTFGEFRKHLAAVLSDVLPARFGPVTAVTPESETSNGYRVTADGTTFSITFNLSKPGPGLPETTCVPGSRQVTCGTRALPGGGRAMAGHEGQTGSDITDAVLSALIHQRAVGLYIFADRSADVAPPISDKELLALAADPRFLALVKEWAAHPQWVPDESLAIRTVPHYTGTTTRPFK